jgi:hypothetical protein
MGALLGQKSIPWAKGMENMISLAQWGEKQKNST